MAGGEDCCLETTLVRVTVRLIRRQDADLAGGRAGEAQEDSERCSLRTGASHGVQGVRAVAGSDRVIADAG